MNALTSQLVRLTTSDPPKADQKLATVNPSTSRPTMRNNKALITTTPRPIVRKMNGNVKSTSSGLRMALQKLSNTTTASSVAASSHRIPLTIRVASITPSASTSHRTNSCTKGDFIA